MWWSRRAVGLHLTAGVVVPACAALCTWQVHRALSGNSLSWAYVFEWPLFGGYAIYMWWRLIHEPLAPPATAPAPAEGTDRADRESPEPATGSVAAPAEEDDELAAYNRYLASLNAEDRPKRW
jgi:hypothetical protein